MSGTRDGQKTGQRPRSKGDRGRIQSKAAGAGDRGHPKEPARIEWPFQASEYPHFVKHGQAIRSVEAWHPVGPKCDFNARFQKITPSVIGPACSRVSEERTRSRTEHHRRITFGQSTEASFIGELSFVGLRGVVEMSEQPRTSWHNFKQRINRV